MGNLSSRKEVTPTSKYLDSEELSSLGTERAHITPTPGMQSVDMNDAVILMVVR